jgi:hypothetical protein
MQMVRDTPVFEEDGESGDEGNDIDVRVDQHFTQASLSAKSSDHNQASELPPSRVNERLPLHKKIITTSQQSNDILVKSSKHSEKDLHLTKKPSPTPIKKENL